MGYHSSPAVTLLLTMFDARLGWWLPNPNLAGSDAAAVPRFSGWWLIAEMLGLTKERGRLIYLSDGGHFENLGIYELVRRRCRFILCVDSSADPDRDFADLGDAIQKCRVDFGVDIEIDDVGFAQRRGRRIQALLRGRHDHLCRRRNRRSPVSQTFDRRHANRRTSRTTRARIRAFRTSRRRINTSTKHNSKAIDGSVKVWRRQRSNPRSNARRRSRRPRLTGSSASPIHTSRNGFSSSCNIAGSHRWRAYRRASRSTPIRCRSCSPNFAKRLDLGILDAQIYPPWTDLVAAEKVPGSEDATPYERRTRLPSPEHFRSCFYFCQELIQLMEAVYHDMDLEHAWKHPDNRGWMNIFRHWTWSPMFRVAWAVGSPTFGRSFLTFCELRLDLPRLNALVGVEDASPKGAPWARHCDELAKTGRINHIEHAMLASEPVRGHVKADDLRLLLLEMRWQPILERSSGHISATTCGIAVIDGTTLRMLRVQDHLRRMGLGLEFMRGLLKVHGVDRIEVKHGFYGPVGRLTEKEALASSAYLAGLLSKARTQ